MANHIYQSFTNNRLAWISGAVLIGITAHSIARLVNLIDYAPPSKPLSPELEVKARALAEKMVVVKEVRFGIDETTEAHTKGFNYAWSKPTIWINKEDNSSLATISHELAHIQGQHLLQSSLLSVAIIITYIVAPNRWGPIIGILAISQGLGFALGRWQEKQADLNGAAHIDQITLAQSIRQFTHIAYTGKLYYQGTKNAPWYIKWPTRIALTPEGNNRFHLRNFPAVIDVHPAHTTRASYLLEVYEKKDAMPP